MKHIIATIILLTVSFHLSGSVVMSATDPEQYFIRPNITSNLSWQVIETQTEQPSKWNIVDYSGKIVSSGTVIPKNGKIILKVNLPEGYFCVDFPERKKQFGIYVSQKFKGRPDMFFGIDSAMSWLVTGKQKLHIRKKLIKILAENGVFLARERFSMADINPQKGKYHFVKGGRDYSGIRKLYQKYGIRLLEVCHDAPGWMKTSQSSPFPSELTNFAASLAYITKKIGYSCDSVEIWNEPDINFGGKFPAEYYMPMVKVVSRYFTENSIEIPITAGAFTDRCQDSFLLTCFASGLLECVDSISFHHYGSWKQLIPQISQYRNLSKKFGRPAIPLIVSEAGKWYLANDAFPTGQTCRLSASEIALKTREAKAGGIRAFYPFVYAYYKEGEATFSMWSKDFSPLPPLAAYFTVVKMLNGMKYTGDIGKQEARVFSATSGNKVIVITSPQLCEKLPTDAVIYGIDGRKITRQSVVSAIKNDGLVYWKTRSVGFPLETNTTAMACLIASKEKDSGFTVSAPVLLSPVLFDSNGKHFSDKGGCNIEYGQKNAIIKFKVSNLTGKELSNCSLSAYINGQKLTTQPTPARFTLPGNGDIIATCKLNLPEKPDPLKTYMLQIKGYSNGKPVLPFAMAMNFQGKGLAAGLNNNSVIMNVDITRKDIWNTEKTRNGKIITLVTPQQTLLFNVKFPDNKPAWFYPEMKITHKLNSESAIMMRLRSPSSGCTFMALLRERDGSVYAAGMRLDADDKWHKIIVPLKAFHLLKGHSKDENNRLDYDQINRLSIGASTKTPEASLEISDLIFFNQK